MDSISLGFFKFCMKKSKLENGVKRGIIFVEIVIGESLSLYCLWYLDLNCFVFF